jgi:hypothetical protein
MKNLCFLLVFFVAQSAAAQTAWRIEPGRYIGNTRIDSSVAGLSRQLGPADGGDAAMGKAWGIWYSRKSDKSIDSSRYLAVYSSIGSGDDIVHHIRQVRINTASFKTKAGIKVGSSFASVKKAFPKIIRAATYEEPMLHKRIEIYDDVKQGIAFEITGKKCTAISVHERGESVNTYLQLPGYERYKKR